MEDMAMRTNLDFSSLFRSSVGYDRVFDLLENTSRVDADKWPPYDIVKMDDDNYSITMAVAGFSQDELTLIHEPNLLVVSGAKAAEDNRQYLYRGIADQAFEHRFELADHVSVAGANLENGLLTIDLRREIPEEMKPRRIEIGTVGGQQTKGEPHQIGAGKYAA
jgi:molecular chaperone IbpA